MRMKKKQPNKKTVFKDKLFKLIHLQSNILEKQITRSED